MRHQIGTLRPDDPAATEPDPQAAALRRYLGAAVAGALLSGSARDHERFAAAATLVSARYAVGTYLPRHLLARQLASERAQPWLEWVAGSLLFVDVSGSTALAERLSTRGREGSEIVTDTLNRYFGTMIGLIEQAGGDLLTFGGDALLVLFDGPDHARAATHAALTLLRELSDFRRHVTGVGTFPLSMHIGVESGRVALVSAGHPEALRYSAMGHTVNSVARAESYGGRGELVLGPQAWSAVATDAIGEEIEAGYVRVRALRGPVPEAPATPEDSSPGFDLAALIKLAGQIDRISPYLPPALLDRILADPQRPNVEADLRPVTVLFAQVDGLGELVESLPAEQAAAAVDAFLRPMQQAVQQFGGFINKLDLADQGDKLLAIFGAPVALEDHAERAARAALAMMGSLQEGFREGFTLPENPPLRLRIGINTGNVFAGNVGSAERKEYTVMGDAVNVSARVMSQSAWGEIRCSAATAARIDQVLRCSEPQAVRVKGKSEPLMLLRLDGERSETLPADVPDAPLIGRDEELTWLSAQLDTARRGKGRVVRISGDAGIGKSRLAAELLEKAVAEGNRVLQVRCHSFNTASPFAPWGDLLRELCGINASDSSTAREQKLRAALNAAYVSADDWLSLMAEIIRFETPDSSIVRALDPQQRQTRRFEIILDLLRSATRAEPRRVTGHTLVIVFDHLQWADQVSLDLWQYLAGQIDSLPLLMLGLHRGAINWGGGPQGDGAHELTLGDLPSDACINLIDALDGDAPLAPALRAQIIERAAGNPLFLEELLRAVQSDTASVEALPDSLSGLLLARIDRLDERSRSLIRVASVIGQRFPVGVLQSVHVEDYRTLIEQLANLDAQELTSTEREVPERVHLFRHSLLQEVVYQSLLYARRRELHRRIGEYLERRYSAELDQVRAEYGAGGQSALVQIGRNGSLLSRAARTNGTVIFLLAHHYRLSDSVERAVPYLLLAGHIARDDYANEQAIQYYRWAIEALEATPNDPYAWEAHEALGDVLCTLGRYDEAQAEYASLLTPPGAQVSGTGSQPPTSSHLPPAVAAEVLRSWGDALEKQGRFSEALEKLHAAEAICVAALNHTPPLLLAAIYADTGLVLRRLGDYDQALAICESGLAKIRDDRKSVEDERIEADLQQQVGTIYGMRGQYEQARFHFANALAAQEAIDDLFGCSKSHNNLGYLAQLQSDYARAVIHYDRAEELARKVNSKYMLSSVLLNAAYAYQSLGRFDDAEERSRQAHELCAAMGDSLGVAQADDTLGLIAFGRGDYAGSLEHYTRALAIYRDQGSSYQEGNTYALQARTYSALGDMTRGRALATQAAAVGERIQAPQLQLEALLALAEADLLSALPTAADRSALLAQTAEQAAAAATLAEQLGSRLDYGVARRLQGRIAAARGEEYAGHFLAALETFEQINSRFEYARTEARYGEILAACNDPEGPTYLKRAAETFRDIGANGELRKLSAHLERSN